MILNRRRASQAGAAMVEGAIVMGLLIMMVLGSYYAWRTSRVAMETKVALRCEMISHALAVNSSSRLNDPNWTYSYAGFSNTSDFYCDIGMFEDVAEGTNAPGNETLDPKDRVHLTHGQPVLFNSALTWDVFDAMKRTLVGAAAVNVTVEPPEIPLINLLQANAAAGESSVPTNYSQTAVCSVNPWSLRHTQAFAATHEWLIQMEQFGATGAVPESRALLDEVESVESLPRDGR